MNRKHLFDVPWRQCVCPDKPRWWHVPKKRPTPHTISCLANHVTRKHGLDDPAGEVAKAADKLRIDPKVAIGRPRNLWMWHRIAQQGVRPADWPNHTD